MYPNFSQRDKIWKRFIFGMNYIFRLNKYILRLKVWEYEGMHMVIEISKKEIKEYEQLKIISELTMIREKIRLFEGKYGCSLVEFNQKMGNKDENFEEWDDFIEWTAYIESEKHLIEKLDEVEKAQDIKITKNQPDH